LAWFDTNLKNETVRALVVILSARSQRSTLPLPNVKTLLFEANKRTVLGVPILSATDAKRFVEQVFHPSCVKTWIMPNH
jgi:hypothetical protein